MWRVRTRSKYGAKKTTLWGEKFDSRREAQRYRDLRLLEAAGEIIALERQVKFPLKVNAILVCTYIADFTYRERAKLVSEDVKGARKGGAWSAFQLKRKLMKAIYGLDIRIT